MKLSKNQSGNVGLIAVALIAGLVIGFAIVKVADKNKVNKPAAGSVITASAETLSNNLVTLGLQHMNLTDQAVDAALDGSPSAPAIEAQLFANGNSIGAAVGSVYGTSAQTTFDAVWKLHLTQFVNYAVADKEGNAAGKTAALNAIQTGYTIPLAQYLAKANPNLPENVLQTDLSDHVAMTATMIDDHVQGNYVAEAAELNMADQHIEGIFSTLASGIVKQFPAKFAN
jgi:hypothetical protein